jgi:predicted RNA binding protein YcfA (HicA-like mRNA interferase family)
VSGGRGDQMKLVKAVRKQGFRVERTGGGHWKVTNTSTGEFVFMSFSPNKTRQLETLKRLHNIGFKERSKR